MKTFEDKIKESTPSLVVFIHAGQQNAVDIKYLLESLRSKYDGKVNIMRVDSSYDGRLKRRFSINAYPTWVLFKEGEELMRESGKKTETELSELIERAF